MNDGRGKCLNSVNKRKEILWKEVCTGDGLVELYSIKSLFVCTGH